ncbi:MAG: NifB/NifX family molybdenum-iron cluster-binding protein [Candidatus Cloacimonadota bacterium]|nr:NifB/NifX family molybdenum-iron cluster-binding protein [Candidatus Cloacimonadota bacterium]
MKIAFTAQGPSWNDPIDPRFGRAQYLLIYDEEKDKLTVIDNTAINQVAHGAGPETARKLFQVNPNILITGNGPGGNAARVLENAQISVFIGAGSLTVEQAYQKYKNNELEKL